MSYTANQYNYCTPLSSVSDFTNVDRFIEQKKFFTLHSNVLDGTYVPVSGDVGLWGTSVSNSSGVLPSAFVVTVEVSMTVKDLQIVSNAYAYPVDFTVSFYNGSTLLDIVNVTGHTSAVCNISLGASLTITKYVITVSKISAPNSVVKMSQASAFEMVSIASNDTLKVVHNTKHGTGQVLASKDTLKVLNTTSTKLDVMLKSTDKVDVAVSDNGELFNIHSVMKALTRRVFGKVYITYTDPMLSDSAPTATASSTAYNSNLEQLTDNNTDGAAGYFTLYKNDLSGKYYPLSIYSQVGWVSGVLSNANGEFATAPYVTLNFAARPVLQLYIHFDENNLVKDFVVEITNDTGNVTSQTFTGNESTEVLIVDELMSDVVSIKVTVLKVSNANSPAIILDIPMVSTILYKGYEDVSELISIDMLEELTYEDDIEALGGVSANEVTVVLDNTSRVFNINNTNSPLAKQLKRNRKIVPWLGAEVVPGTIEWYKLGTYWAYNWNVPFNSLVATVVGFDTLGLLDTTSFTKHQTLRNRSLGALVDYVLTDANSQLGFLEWNVADELYDVIIPYAWFDNASHTAALRRISKAYPMHIYCDREGRIIAAPQKLRLDYYLDVWSDSTNVIDKSYDSLHTVLPNIINITVINCMLAEDVELVRDEMVFSVPSISSRILNFSSPFVENFTINVDADSSVSYTYEVYSWGVVINFKGSGSVRSIICSGTALDTSHTSTFTMRDDNSIYLNGAVTRDVKAEFIQTSELASYISGRLSSLSENDKYDAEVIYRGDIALSINDPILLLDGIAPDNRYNIKRHQLTWDGALSGTAYINT